MDYMDHVRRKGKGKRLSQANLRSGDPKRGVCLACWEDYSAAAYSTNECPGDATVFMRFSLKEVRSELPTVPDSWGETTSPGVLEVW